MEIEYNIVKNVAIISWNMSTSPMNVLNDNSIPEFVQCLEESYQNPEVKGIVITSAKNEFIAGADVKMILRNNEKDPVEMLKFSLEFNAIFRKLETCGKPVVAAMNGTALGGGYEVCLACHHRIALNNPKAQIGLPEVQLGLLPGGGGTQRLPRLIGVEKALGLMLVGKRVAPKEAFELKMVDELVDTKEELIEKSIDWVLQHPNAMQPWDERVEGVIKSLNNYSVPNGTIESDSVEELLKQISWQIRQVGKDNYPAPKAILSCVEEGLKVNIDSAIPIEAKYFVEVATSKEAKNLIGVLFLGKNDLEKGVFRPKNIPKNEVRKLGIIGAGFMGSGIAYSAALAGIRVVLIDSSLENAMKGKGYSLKLVEKNIQKGFFSEAKAQQLLDNIMVSDSFEDLNDCDLLIEAVFENREIKAEIIQKYEYLLRDKGFFASNTSTLPISGLAKFSKKPENFIGIHFFSPVDKMMLVEIIRGAETSDECVAKAFDFVKQLRKTPIIVNDSRGFYTSRTFSTYTSEGFELLREGVEPERIENAGKVFGMPVGPLAVSDEVALDLVLKIANQAIADGDSDGSDAAYQVSQLMVEKLGRLGKKNKKGFYEYPVNGSKFLWQGLGEYFPLDTKPISDDDISNRLIYRQVIESIRCLEEGVLCSALEGNLGSILGWGFPTYAGGTLSYPSFVGKDIFLNTADYLAEYYGERFRLTQKQREIIGDL